jgi:serine/threonine-protein kinase
LHDGPIDVKKAVRYMDQVLSALDFAHSRDIIHRDIKPANIIVSPGDVVKLTDFGIARSGADRNLTQTGLALGSLYYMSPEQVQAQQADQRSDIYSLGVTFYEMVTGKRPIDGSSEYNILTAHLNYVPPPPGTLNPAVPIMLGAAIMKAMAKLPEERFQSATEFRTALRQIEGFTTLRAITEPAPTRAAPTVAFASPMAPDSGRAQIETALLKTVGPIAKVLMARIAPQCSTTVELRDRLAEHISDPDERTKFLRQAAAVPVQSTKQPADVTQWDPVVLATAKQQLAVYAGPIASVIVDRAAKRARTPQELYQMLASEIASERDRAAFLKLTPWGR